MEREEVKKLLVVNMGTFPNFYDKIGDRDLALQITTWHAIFQGFDSKQVKSAFLQALSRAKFPVKPGDVTEILEAHHKANLPTTDELFGIAERAADRIAQCYHQDIGWHNEEQAQTIYQELPAVLREWKHSPDDLLHWWWTITYDNESYIRTQFDQALKDHLERREVLGIDFGAEFHPEFNKLTGFMKEMPALDNKQKKLTNKGAKNND